MGYEELRTEYIAAFERLRRADCELGSIRRLPSPGENAEETAWRRFVLALGVYRAARKCLADYLLLRRPAGELEAQVLAPRLWEAAGRRTDGADEHWYRAEEILRRGQGNVFCP